MGSLVSAITSPVASIVGGALSFLGGRQQAQATTSAANTQAQIAQQAAQQAQFRPVGVTTRFGTSQFGFTGDQLSSAGYTPSPEIKALQDRLAALYQGSLGLAETAPAVSQRLFNLGASYLSESPEEARQRIFNELETARMPSRLQEEQRLAQGLFGRGRAGLNISGLGQPELYSLARAREAQRAADIVAAEEQAQRRIQSGLGFIGTGIQLPAQALAPFQAQFGTEQLLEEVARAPLDIGAQLGGRTAAAGARAGESLLTGGLLSARTRLAGQTQAISTGQDLLQSFIKNLNFGRSSGVPQYTYGEGYAPYGTSFGE